MKRITALLGAIAALAFATLLVPTPASAFAVDYCPGVVPYSANGTTGFVHPWALSQAQIFSSTPLQSGQHQVRLGPLNCLVVDVWNNGPRDALRVSYSVSKFIMYTTMMHLKYLGLFEWSDKVSQYWPAFGQNGKQDITIDQLFSNRACIPAIPTIDISNIIVPGDFTVLRTALEQAYPTSHSIPGLVPPNPVDNCTIGGAPGYSPIVIGWYWQFLVGFLDPVQHRNGTTYVNQVIVPLLNEQLSDGAQPIEFYWDIQPGSPLNARVVVTTDGPSIVHADPNFAKLITLVMTYGTVQFQAVLNPIELAFFDNTANPNTRNILLPAGDLYTTADSLMQIVRVFAKVIPGRLGFLSYLVNPATIAYATQRISYGPDFTEFFHHSYARAGFFMSDPEANFILGGNRAFGHDGAGGSLAFVDPARHLAFVYLTSLDSSVQDYSELPLPAQLLLDNINRLVPPIVEPIVIYP